MKARPTEVLSIKITKAEMRALNRIAAQEAMRTGKSANRTAIVREALAKYLKAA